MVAVPGASAVTTPAGETVTAAGLSLDQVTGDSLSVSPTPSLRVTVRVNDWPSSSVALTGWTSIVAVAPTRSASNDVTHVLLSGQVAPPPVMRSSSTPVVATPYWQPIVKERRRPLIAPLPTGREVSSGTVTGSARGAGEAEPRLREH